MTLGAEQRGADVRVSVSDRGPGIPRDFRDRIFQRFAQADSSTTRQREGTGLGLSISKAIVEHLGGRIGFETQEGAGTTFFIDLPQARAAVDSASVTVSDLPRAHPARRGRPGRPGRHGVRAQLGGRLLRGGVRIGARGPRPGRSLRSRPDPARRHDGGHGWTEHPPGRCRDLPAAADIPVVFMTAKVQPHEIARYRELGSLAVISKPFDPRPWRIACRRSGAGSAREPESASTTFSGPCPLARGPGELPDLGNQGRDHRLRGDPASAPAGGLASPSATDPIRSSRDVGGRLELADTRGGRASEARERDHDHVRGQVRDPARSAAALGTPTKHSSSSASTNRCPSTRASPSECAAATTRTFLLASFRPPIRDHTRTRYGVRAELPIGEAP